MSEEGKPVGNTEEATTEGSVAGELAESQLEEVMALTQATDLPTAPIPTPPSPQQQSQQTGYREPVVDDAQLLTRIAVGLLTSGSGDLMQRLRDLEQDIETNPDLVEPLKSEDEETTSDLVRYLAIGLLMRSQRAAIRGARTGFYLSLGTASWFFEKLGGLTRSRLVRPFTSSVSSRLGGLDRTTAELIAEGKRQEQVSKLLAREATLETIDDITEVVSENPEITNLLKDVIGGQSMSLGRMMTNSARQLSMSSDDTVEGTLRRLLRRTPRKELPPSPLVGQSQTMYTVEVPQEQMSDDEQ
jgi:hypothetical protein